MPNTQNSSKAWSAVQWRDRTQDGRFVYAVASTGVYCRPSCPARRPRRANVRFFDQAGQAQAAGYRACLRCRPDASGPDASAQRIAAARAYIEARPGEPVTLPELARAVGVSPYHLQRTFKAATGLSPKAYHTALRMGRLKAQLKQGRDVTTALYAAGYGSSSRLYENAGERLGMTPGTYRKGGHGVRIAYTTLATRLGRLLVAATERGVCAVAFGTSAATLLAELREEYPQAAIRRERTALEPWVRAVRARVSGTSSAVAVPLDMAGTAFEQRVWRALQAIPPGATRSYSEVAAALGRPRAARAVARACAANHVALLVPCHRVVRRDGSAGGYRWGAARKARLLAGERQQAAAKRSA